MPRINIDKVLLSIQVTLDRETMESRLVSSPAVLGLNIASDVYEYVQEKQLGYYPALSYFAEAGLLDADLVNVTREVGWFACEYVKGLVRRHLQPVFSHLRMEHFQCLAFTMPGFRPGQDDDLEHLARHFTPDSVRFTLMVSSIERDMDARTSERRARQKVWRWLSPHFASLDITASQYQGAA